MTPPSDSQCKENVKLEWLTVLVLIYLRLMKFLGHETFIAETEQSWANSQSKVGRLATCTQYTFHKHSFLGPRGISGENRGLRDFLGGPDSEASLTLSALLTTCHSPCSLPPGNGVAFNPASLGTFRGTGAKPCSIWGRRESWRPQKTPVFRSLLCVGLASSTGLQWRPRQSLDLCRVYTGLPGPSIHQMTFCTYIFSSLWSPHMPEMNQGKEKELSIKSFKEYKQFHLI